MDNPETQVAFDTRHRTKTKKKQNHNVENWKDEQH